MGKWFILKLGESTNLNRVNGLIIKEFSYLVLFLFGFADILKDNGSFND